MSTHQPSLLCHNRYDPLDRLISQTQPDTPAHQRFYCKSRLATEIQGALQHSIVQHDDLLLAQQQRQGDNRDTLLLSTDLQRSVLHTLKASQPAQPNVYTPYGHHLAESGLSHLLGFNGERPDPVTGHYLLGNGYRAFNPVVMRFNSPDSLSPFGRGGLNSYAYCLGDPVNLSDSDGHSVFSIVRAAVHWRRFARAAAASKAEAKLINSAEPRTILINWPNLHRVSLRPEISAEAAIAARKKMNDLMYRSFDYRLQNQRFINDLEVAKRDGRFMEVELNIPLGQNRRFKLLNYLKRGEMEEYSVFSFVRLQEAANGRFDPNVSLVNRPEVSDAGGYLKEVQNVNNPDFMLLYKEAERIRDKHFIRPQ